MSKILKIGNGALTAILAVLGIVFTVLAIPASFERGDIFPDFNSKMADFAISDSYILIGLCTLVAIGAFLVMLFTNFKKNYMVLVWIIVLLVIVGICWSIASGSLPAESTQMGKKWLKLGVTEGTSKFAGMAGFLSYFFIGTSIAAIIFFEVRNLFK